MYSFLKNNLVFRVFWGGCLVFGLLFCAAACEDESWLGVPVSGIPERMPSKGSIPDPDSSLLPVQYKNCVSYPCVAIVAHSTLNNRQHEVSIPNHLAYARKHEYDYFFRNGTISHDFFDSTSGDFVKRHGLYWQKLVAVLSLLEKRDETGMRQYNRVLWLDPDVLITDFDTTIDDLFVGAARLSQKKNLNLIIAEDGFRNSSNKVNSGVFVLENTEWSRNLLRKASALFPSHKDYGAPEQRALQDVIFGKVKFRTNNSPISVQLYDDSDYEPSEVPDQAAIVPQRFLNSLYGGSGLLPGSMWCAGDFLAHFAGAGAGRDQKMEALQGCLDKSSDGGKSCEARGNSCF